MDELSWSIETLYMWNTGLCADSVEWCPIDNYRNIFVCATYQLLENDGSENTESGKRIGKIYLFAFEKNMNELNPMQTIDTAAVLDQKWCHQTVKGKPLLGVVNASGFLQLYSLIDVDGKLSLNLIVEIAISDDEKCLALSLDWSNNKFNTDPIIAVSDSKGNVKTFDFNADLNILTVVDILKAHDYEAWICAFDSWNPSIIFTGGDDCKLKIFDRRSSEHPQRVINSDAGVTSFHSNTDQEYILASGGYDQFIRIWDTRNMKRNLSEIDSGGGVWRLKWEPSKHKHLLAACMYGGFAILDCDNHNLNILAKYDHESISYGADWCHDTKLFSGSENISDLIATCSFYNCKLTVASIKVL